MHLLTALFVAALQGDPETEQALRTFAREYASPAALARAAAVGDLGRLRNPTTRAKLAGFLTADENGVRIAAAEALGGFTEEKEKVSALLAGALPANARLFDVEAAILTAMGKLGEDTSLPAIHQHFDSREPKDVNFAVAGAAIAAAGVLRSRESIGPLLDLGKKFQKATGSGAKKGTPAGGAKLGIPGGGAPDPQAMRAKALTPAVVKALQAITREKWSTLAEWDLWWEKHQATFKVEK
jgi:HEAT repeat protein